MNIMDIRNLPVGTCFVIRFDTENYYSKVVENGVVDYHNPQDPKSDRFCDGIFNDFDTIEEEWVEMDIEIVKEGQDNVHSN